MFLKTFLQYIPIGVTRVEPGGNLAERGPL